MHIKTSLVTLFLLTACTSKQNWSYSEVVSKRASFNSAQLIYEPENATSGIGLEFLRGSFGTIGYVYVLSRQIPALPHDVTKAKIVMQVGGETFSYDATRLKGGQRLLLPGDVTETLLVHLGGPDSVTLRLDGYLTTFDPSESTVVNFLETKPQKQNRMQTYFKPGLGEKPLGECEKG